MVFDWAIDRYSIEEALTVAFTTMVTFEWFRAFNARSDELTVIKLGILNNKWLVSSRSIAITLYLMVVYTPFMQVTFGTVAIGLDEWGIPSISS